MSRRLTALIAAGAVAALCLWAWRFWWPNDERQIERRLKTFAETFNESTTDGLGTVARAARLADYFTDDVVVELGGGSPPIRGRETLIGMAARLQPRTAAFKLELVDMNTRLESPSTAEVNLTASFRRGGRATGDESIDAQELMLRMVKVNGEWRVGHVTAVEPFK